MGETNGGESARTDTGAGGPETRRPWSDPATDEREVDDAIVLAASFLAILAVGVVLNAVLTDSQELITTQLILAALIPPVLYLFAVDEISSVEFPGLFKIVKAVSTKAVPTDDASLTEALPVESPQGPASEEGVNAITVFVGAGYDEGTIQAEIEREPGVEYVVYVDADGRVEGMSSVAVARERPEFGDRVADRSILDDADVVTELVYEHDTAVGALRKLDREDADFLPAVDENDKLVGVITRSDIYAEILDALEAGRT